MPDTTLVCDKQQMVNDLPVVTTAGIGLFLSTLDTGIINVALPTFQGIFHVSVSTVVWAVTLYLLSLSVTIVMFGRLSDIFGRVRIYSWGLGLFAVASILCGLSNTAVQLVSFRALQGLGAAMLQATAAAIITTYVPEERRGAAFGTLGMMIGLGPVLGPSAGGFLLSFVGWRWIFWINIPICIVGIVGCTKLANVKSDQRQHISLDVPGIVLLALTALSLIYGLSTSGRAVPFLIFLISVCFYAIWEVRAAQPIVPVSMFKQAAFTVPIFAVAILGLATAVAFVVPPYFLEKVSNAAPWQVGLVNLATPLGLVVLSKISGRKIEAWGTVRLMTLGLVIMFIALFALSCMQDDWNAVLIESLLLLYGVGAGIFVPPNLAAVMNSVGPQFQGTIGAVQRMVQNIGIAIGASAAASMIQFHENSGVATLMWGFREAWLVAAVMVLLSALGMVSLRSHR